MRFCDLKPGAVLIPLDDHVGSVWMLIGASDAGAQWMNLETGLIERDDDAVDPNETFPHYEVLQGS